jgi:hypothetical protein
MDLTLLDVAIGMVMIYSLLSLICSTINEGISSFFSLRAATLKSGLENLLGSDLAKQVYDHHLVQGLVQKDILLKWKRKPSYIPTRTFVMTLLDTMHGGFPASADDVRLAVQKIPDQKIQRALLALVDDAQGDMDKIKKNFGVWFDHSMDRVSGWYRRKVQMIILILGILASFGIGVDSIATVKRLWGDSVLRSALVDAAQAEVAKKQPPPQTAEQVAAAPAAPNFDQVGKNLKDLQSQFSSLEIPTYPPNGICAEWKAARNPGACEGFFGPLGFWLRRHWLGFIITSAALSLGAPFWFDLLNKLVSMRSAGQKPVPEAAVIQAQGQS